MQYWNEFLKSVVCFFILYDPLPQPDMHVCTYSAIPHVGSKRRFLRRKGQKGRRQRVRGQLISLQFYFYKTINNSVSKKNMISIVKNNDEAKLDYEVFTPPPPSPDDIHP